MRVNIQKILNDKLEQDMVHVILEYSKENNKIEDFIEYINKYDTQKITVAKDNNLVQIELKDILCFYSDKKHNYCKTINGEYRIKSKLYEIEKMNNNFLRISKSCIVNIEQVKCFDIGETGKIIVKFYDDSEQIVSRRKIRDVMNYLDERGI